MFKDWHFRGLQWKITILYTLLLLFALQLIGVFLVQSLERYYLRNHVKSVETQAKLMAQFLTSRIQEDDQDNIIELVEGFRGYQETDIIVLDRYSRVLGVSGHYEIEEGSWFLQEEITRALGGNPSDDIRVNPENDNRYYCLAYPIHNDGAIHGVIYLSSSLKSIDETLGEIKGILITGSLSVLAISATIGIILARTITNPIREVTKKAADMARGNFSASIKVHSEDEIGHLAKMFNYLAFRLDTTLNEISSEKSKVEALLNYMNDGIVAFDGNGNLIHVNPAARKLLSQVTTFAALNEDEANLSLLEQLTGKEAFLEFEESRKPFTIEVNFNKQVNFNEQVNFNKQVGGDNPFLILQVSVAPFKGEQGRLRGVLVVLHDVTQEREISKRQQEFVANVSHELKTPLTSIKSYLEALLDGAIEDPSVRHDFLDVVDRETHRMVSLVQGLLELSRLDEHSLVLNRKTVILREIVEEVIEKATITNNSTDTMHDPSIILNINESLQVYVDRDRIYQVFLNLLNNAFKYTSADGTVEIFALEKEEWVQVCVKDNGTGIPPEEINRVFERFYRVEKTRSRDYGGTGLGLSICKKVVEVHGGNIWIDSEVEKGTAVWITLPKSG